MVVVLVRRCRYLKFIDKNFVRGQQSQRVKKHKCSLDHFRLLMAPMLDVEDPDTPRQTRLAKGGA